MSEASTPDPALIELAKALARSSAARDLAANLKEKQCALLYTPDPLQTPESNKAVTSNSGS